MLARCPYRKAAPSWPWGDEMNWFWMYIRAGLIFAGLWSGIPRWLVLKHPDRGPRPQVVPVPRGSGQPAGVWSQ